MPPDRLVITEMIEAATRIIDLAGDRPTSDIDGDREHTGILLDTARDDLPSLVASLRRVLDGLEQEG
jgi:hypothetical protein